HRRDGAVSHHERAGDDTGAVAPREQRPPHRAREFDEPLLPGLAVGERAHAAHAVVEDRLCHEVDELLLGLDVPIESRSVHAEVLGEPAQAKLLVAAVVEQRERGLDDLAAALSDGFVGAVSRHSVDKAAGADDISDEFNTVKFLIKVWPPAPTSA